MAKLKKPTIKNPELKMAVQEWKENRNSVTEEKMFEALKKAQFIAPAIMEELPEDVDLSDGKKYETKAKFMLVKDNKGNQFFPAFTEWLEVLKWNNDPETQTVVVTFENYCALLLNKNPEARGIVVDPKGMNLMVPTAIFAKAKGINIPTPNTNTGAPAADGVQRKKVNMNIKDLPEYPQELIDKYKNHFSVIDSILAAYILGMENKDDPNMKSYFLILDIADLTDDARKVIFDQIGKIAQPYVNAPIGLMPKNSPLGKQIASTHKPFYTVEGYVDDSKAEEAQSAEQAENTEE